MSEVIGGFTIESLRAKEAVIPESFELALVLAAPDLLEALQDLKREIILSDVDMDYIDSHFKPWLDKARAAITKAGGEA